MVLQDLVNNGSYNMTSLAGHASNIDTLSIRGDNTTTALTISSQDVQHMVNNANTSELFIKADSGDTLNISLSAGESMSQAGPQAFVFNGAGDYTVYDAAHHQIAQIHWQTS
jgi:outer membrane lipoprotein SlyB